MSNIITLKKYRNELDIAYSKIDTLTKTLNILVNVYGDIWSLGPETIEAKTSLGSSGDKNSTLAFGGLSAGKTTNTTEKFNGSTWKSDAYLNIIKASSVIGVGKSENSTLAFSGINTEKYNGISWATAATSSTNRTLATGCGEQNAALYIGGNQVSTPLATTELYNDITWATSSDLNTARAKLTSIGSTLSTLAFSGSASGVKITGMEVFNGTAWSSNANSLIINRELGSTFGSSLLAVCSGGDSEVGVLTSSSEKYNGTAWSSIGSLQMPLSRTSSTGSYSKGFNICGASTPSVSSSVKTTHQFLSK